MTNQLHQLRMSIRMNVYYHEGLERFYGGILNWTAFFSLMLSSTALAALGDVLPAGWKGHGDLVAGVLAVAVAVLNGVVLAFGVMTKAGLHRELKQKWIALLTDAENDEVDVKHINRVFHRINAEEPPPIKSRLDAAYDAACESGGLPTRKNQSHLPPAATL